MSIPTTISCASKSKEKVDVMNCTTLCNTRPSNMCDLRKHKAVSQISQKQDGSPPLHELGVTPRKQQGSFGAQKMLHLCCATAAPGLPCPNSVSIHLLCLVANIIMNNKFFNPLTSTTEICRELQRQSMTIVPEFTTARDRGALRGSKKSPPRWVAQKFPSPALTRCNTKKGTGECFDIPFPSPNSV